MDFGTRLKQVRKARNMTQLQLAKLLGVEQSAISNYEKNLRTPTASIILQVASHLGVRVDELLVDVQRKSVEQVSSEIGNTSINELKSRFLEDVLEGRELSALQPVLSKPVSTSLVADIIHDLIEPTLRRTGDLWEAGELEVAEEHIISERISNVITLLGNAAEKDPTRPYTALFVLPGAEEHILALKMAAELFSLRGWKTFFLGRSVPISSLASFVREQGIDLLVLSLTIRGHLNSAGMMIRVVDSFRSEGLPLVLVGGEALSGPEQALTELGADLYAKTLAELGQMIPQYERDIDSIKQISKP
ncbi:MAG TPA: helix-turn-helix domain-containing protein [Bacillota bacterium]|nr:helix-turn-helix domain-containing protein [Bacillota bacterium]